MALLTQRGDGAQVFSLRTAQQSKHNFPLNQAAEKRYILRRVQEVHKPRTRIQQFHRAHADGHGARIGRLLAKMKLLLGKNLPHYWHREFENQTENRLFLRGRNHLAHHRQIH